MAGVNCGGLSLDGDSRVFVKTFLLNVLTRDPESAAERLHCRDNTCRPPGGEETIVVLMMGAMGVLGEKQMQSGRQTWAVRIAMRRGRRALCHCVNPG